jgi:Cadherin-like beta sandwich domain/FG-GAP-like repeat/IPT/TIG domain/Secretion system C-terminal sorting domain
MITLLRSAKLLTLKTIAGQALLLLGVFTIIGASAQVNPVNFQAQQKFGTDRNPIAPVIADIDGDGKNDLVVANFSALSISVYFNTSSPGLSFGATSFANKVDFPTASNPVFLGVADFNGDGKPDLVVANAGASELTVFRNTATAGTINSSSLVRETALLSDIGMRSLAIADFDGDGRPDLAAVSASTSQLSVYKNTSAAGGGITLLKVLTVATGTSPFGVVAADFNGDGKADVAVANRGDNNLSVYLNNAYGTAITFADRTDFSAGGIAPQALTIADFDSDGFPDLGVLNQASNHVAVLRNNGTAIFLVAVTLPVGTSPSALAVGDLNGDGKPDLVTTNFGNDNISVLLNTGSGNAISFDPKIDFSSGNNPWGAAIDDLDGDGKPDIVVANYSDVTDERTISVLRNSAFAPTVQATSVTYSNTTNNATTVSWNNGNGSKRVVFMRNLNTSTFPSLIDNTTYMPDATYAQGSSVGGWYCVYNGAGSSVNVTGLTTGQTYRIMVLEYNDISGQEKYFPTAATGNPAAVSVNTSLITVMPRSGEVGSTVSINGSGFSTTATRNTVYFGATRAQVTSATTTNLTVAVPKGSTHQPVSVIRESGSQAFARSPFIVTRTGGEIGLQPANVFAAGTNASKTQVGDIDGDGKPDLIVTNSLGIAVLRNITQDGAKNSTFTQVTFAMSGITPTNLIVADLNGDGKLDVAVSQAGTAKIYILVNNSSVGAPSFSRFDILTTANITNLLVADFNMDGRPDIAAISSTGNNVAIYPNTTIGTSINFSGTPAATINLGFTTNSMVAADFNGDGKPDLAIINDANARLYLVQNTGTTTFSFATQPYITTTPNPKQLAVADMDGDGANDLVILGTSIVIYRNISASSTIEFNYVYFVTDNISESLAINDMDGDGKPDMIITGSKALAIIRNSLTSSSFPRTSSVTPDLAESRFYLAPTNGGLALADFDGDGKPDVAVTNNALAGLVMVYRNAPVPTLTSVSPNRGTAGTVVTLTGTNFSPEPANSAVFFGAVKGNVTVATPTSLTVTAPASGSFKNISFTDLSTGIGRMANTPFAVTYPNGLINFVPQQKFATSKSPISPIIVDLDGDGKPDLVVANFGANTISVFRNTSATGSIAAGSFASKVDFATGTSPVNIATGDLNGDGRPDLAVVNAGSNSFSVFINNSSVGAIGFDTKVDIATISPYTSPRAIAIADFDGDGLNDVVTSSLYTNTLLTYRNVTPLNGAFNAIPVQGIPVRTTPFSIVAEDLNGDGKPDIAVAHYGSDKISVIQNQSVVGTFMFASRIDITSGTTGAPQICSMAVADFDGDGKPDLAALNQADNTISVFRNNVSVGAVIDASGFATKADFATGPSPTALTLGDVDGDGRPDLVTSNYGGNSASILRNATTSGSIIFAAKADLVTGDTPWGVAVADLDGDGRQDVVVANYADNTDERTISVFRNGIAPPTAQPTSVMFYNTLTHSTSLSWSRGNGSRVSVFMLEGGSGTPAPMVNTAYTASATFGNGAQIGTSGWYCIYDGTGTTVTATNLKPGTNYRAMVVEYNNNAGGYQQYLSETAQDNPLNVTTTASTDATLSSLLLGAGTLSPVFAAATETYTATVGSAITSITVTPTVNQANATVQVRVNGGSYVPVASGGESTALSLNVGSNTIEVRVMAQDGTSIKIYSVTVSRAGSSNADLASLSITEGTLSPTFVAGTTTYTAVVTATSLRVIATVAQNGATITVNGSPAISGNASGNIALSTGLNIITVVVSAQDGVTTKSYTLNITQESILPVSLISFTVKADRNYALLNWSTAAEQWNKGFEVWRGDSATQRNEGSAEPTFVKIGNVKASHVANVKSQIYSFTDKQPANGANYYKLVQLDDDGESKDLGTRMLNFSFSTSEIRLYPNPTDDLIALSFSAATFTWLEIMDVNGRVLQKIGIRDGEITKVVSLGSYPAGIYIVTVQGAREIVQLKVIRR